MARNLPQQEEKKETEKTEAPVQFITMDELILIKLDQVIALLQEKKN